jgi:hypothetical protein
MQLRENFRKIVSRSSAMRVGTTDPQVKRKRPSTATGIIDGVLFSVGLLLMVVTFSNPARSEKTPLIKRVEVMGSGAIYKQDIASARSRAIANSLATAVDLVAIELIPLETLISEFKGVNDILYNHTSEFIQDYKVLTEYLSEKIYKVMVQATVSVNKVEAALTTAGVETGNKELPKILFLIAEQNLEDILPKYWWGEDLSFSKGVAETALTDAMEAKDFVILDRQDDFTSMGDEEILGKPTLTDTEAVLLGIRFEADVVIVGKSTAHRIPNTMGGTIKAFEGSVALRAIRTDTSDKIASTTENYVTTNTDEAKGGKEAIAGAGSLAGAELALQIAAGWKKAVQKSVEVEIVVKGTRNLGNFVNFRRALKNIPDVKGIQLKEMQSNEAVIVVDYRGNAKKLAEALMLKTFESFGISITEVLEQRLSVELTQG